MLTALRALDAKRRPRWWRFRRSASHPAFREPYGFGSRRSAGLDELHSASRCLWRSSIGALPRASDSAAVKASEWSPSTKDRYGRSCTVITSQLPTKSWHSALNDPTIADAICDRVVHNAHVVELRGPSMRKKTVTDPVKH